MPFARIQIAATTSLFVLVHKRQAHFATGLKWEGERVAGAGMVIVQVLLWHFCQRHNATPGDKGILELVKHTRISDKSTLCRQKNCSPMRQMKPASPKIARPVELGPAPQPPMAGKGAEHVHRWYS
jgi:hypothetical protein